MDPKKIGVVIFSGVTLALLAASFGGNNWIVSDLQLNHILKDSKFGLWKLCVSVCVGPYCSERCGSRSNQVTDKTQAARVFACLALVSGIVGCIVAVVRMCKELNGKIAAGSFLTAGVCMIIALSIFTQEHSAFVKQDGVSYGWSYILGWTSSIICFAAMVIHCKCSSDYENV